MRSSAACAMTCDCSTFISLMPCSERNVSYAVRASFSSMDVALMRSATLACSARNEASRSSVWCWRNSSTALLARLAACSGVSP
ncbi:MAG: hypothetical protein IPG17_32850 [Sandaracinaceae bacterium]|nr:hypothetical protein [Sandaracinaceae bacterium]